jgi:2-hydroxyacyl-CoA lyase 1
MTSSSAPPSGSATMTTTKITGAALVARALQQLDVKVIFGLVGIPVVQIAEEAIALGIRFIAFRNEQAASYAATAYGYLTGRPGVCLVVGGPGVLHAMAGVGNSSANAFPLMLIAGSSETHLVTKGAFQEMDAISLLAPHTKIAIRAGLDTIPRSVSEAFRTAWYGRPGTGFVDLPADVIQGLTTESKPLKALAPAPRAGPDPEQIAKAAELLRSAKAPLIVFGKGAAYARAEEKIRKLVDHTSIPFLPTPMGKGVLPDSHAYNTASARSAALKHADVVLVLGARLNWIMHFGEASKWNPEVRFIQVDLSAEEIGKNRGNAELGIVGDINIVVSQLCILLDGWKYDHDSSPYIQALQASKTKNEATAAKVLAAKADQIPMTYQRTFDVIKQTLHRLSPPEDGNVMYISEGANTMDISRSVFPVEEPRLRMDAGTYATMGVGLAYAIAAHSAYNLPNPEGRAGSASWKKIVCLEGDSAFGFSMPEVETMARYNMDILMFVINNGGIYHGDSDDSDAWLKLQENSRQGEKGGLRSTSLGYQVGYEKMAEMCGGKGFLVHTPEELESATEEGFRANVPVIVNVIIESGSNKKLVSQTQTPVDKNLHC